MPCRERRRLQGKMVAAAKSSLGEGRKRKTLNPSKRTYRRSTESFPLDFSFASVADKLDSFYATYRLAFCSSASCCNPLGKFTLTGYSVGNKLTKMLTSSIRMH